MSAAQRSSAGPLAAAFAALVVYASLYPFTGWRWPPGVGWQQLLALPWPPWRVPFDQWANVLGYLPLGLLLAVALLRGRLGHAGHGWWALPLAWAAASALSYAMELTQHLLPGRHPSARDWAGNSAGALAGALLALLADRLGLLERWQALRDRWFVRESAGALALLALWPLALLFPAPVPLGLGQVGERLREWAWALLEDVPRAEPVLALLQSPVVPGEPLSLLGEAVVTGLGLLAPVLVAYAVVAPGWRRLVLALGALLLAMGSLTLSTTLNFGPGHAWAWLTPATAPGLTGALLLAAAAAPLGRRLSAALGLLALGLGVALVAHAPADPYFAENLQAWEQGRFVQFHGLAQWIGWLWPFAAMGWLLARLGRREGR